MSEFPTNFGRVVLEELSKVTVIEREGWVPQSAERVLERLKRNRPDSEHFEVVVY